MDIFVLVGGLPGSGKSTLAKALATELSLPLLAKDDLKEALMDALGRPETVEASRDLGRAAVLAMLRAARTCPGAVLDSIWLPYARPLVEALPGRLIEVHCQVPTELAQKRYRARITSRHAGHLDGSRDDAELWGSPFVPLAVGPVLDVDTTVPVDIPALARTVIARTVIAGAPPPPVGHDVLVLGGSGVDTVVQVPVLPLPYADSYLVRQIETRAGQTGDGVALGLHALGLRTRLIDVLGDDPEGDLVRAMHSGHGVEFTAIPTPVGTKRAVNLVDPEGHRLSLYDGSRAGAAPFATELIIKAGRAARHAHVSITQPCRDALPLLADLDLTVSTDLHDWDGENPYHEAFADQADLVFLSAAALPDRDATLRKILSRGRARLVVATAGGAGAYLLERGDDAVRHVEAAPLPGAAVDSNGAGDAFVAGFLLGFLAGEPAEVCARLGAVAGAHACTVPSTRVDPISSALLDARR